MRRGIEIGCERAYESDWRSSEKIVITTKKSEIRYGRDGNEEALPERTFDSSLSKTI